jgi:hypothetical protein
MDMDRKARDGSRGHTPSGVKPSTTGKKMVTILPTFSLVGHGWPVATSDGATSSSVRLISACAWIIPHIPTIASKHRYRPVIFDLATGELVIRDV